MQNVNVDKSHLIKRIEQNLKLHRKEYEKAWYGFQEEVEKKLTELLQNVSSAEFKDTIETNVYLQPPQNHEEEYSKVLRMLEMSKDAVITLSSREFDMYVDDNWDWSVGSKTINAMYAKTI